MTEQERPKLNWNGENQEKETEKTESDQSLCHVEDPTCEACQ